MIKYIDETVPEIYIGSTNDYERRQREHKNNCNNLNSKSHNVKLYRFIRSKGGFDKFKFEVIIECEEDDKLELEKMYIDMYNPELNTHKFDFDRKEYMEEYREKNKDKITEYSKEYNIKNKDKRTEYSKEYYKKNNERICCLACKCEISKKDFKKHCNSKKHITNQTNK